ncbi:hypothetical protein [Chelativorans sp.]|uniref:hypothetical protein n=1 Tax=Chelativorans sp. TaxID=2203393 RepID=UPI002811BC29|nr:hypothetical protein [Chelativorans sp.]
MATSTTRLPRAVDPNTVNGWGVDADPRNDPTYPFRDRSREDGPGMAWQRPPLQEPRVEVLRSIEHSRLPAVVGTSTPPKGLSGMIRRAAFRYSESDWRHWLMLLGADRINVVEGIFEDLARGRIPNIPAEMGARAEWRHNKLGLVRKVAIVAAVSAVAVALLRRRGRDDW